MCSGHHTPAYSASGRWNLGDMPHTEEVLATCHLQPLAVCIQRRRHTLFKHYAENKFLVPSVLDIAWNKSLFLGMVEFELGLG